MILITRTPEESEKLAEVLERLNFECLVEPMLTIKPVHPDWENYLNAPIQSFIATSKNGKKHGSPSYPMAAIPAQGKNSYELLQWIMKNLNPEKGKLLYLRGDIISFDIAGELRKHGFTVDEVIVYHSIPPENFSKNLIDNFFKIELALFFSTKTLQNFLNLIVKSNLRKGLKHLRILALSEDILAVAKDFKFKATFVADEPNLNAMINKIDEIY